MTVKSLTNQEAQTRHESIKTRILNLKWESLELGKDLYFFNKNKEYLSLGFVSFRAYCADPDLDFSISTAYMLMGIYEDLILGLKIPTAGLLESSPSKLEIIRPHITADNQEELLSQAHSLGRTDLRKEMRRQFGKQNGHDSLLNRLKMLKSMVWDTLELKMNPIVRGLLEQVYLLLDKVLVNYDNKC